MGTKPFPCPFSSCRASYRTRPDLRKHLAIVKSSRLDEFHRDEDVWRKAEADGLTSINTRTVSKETRKLQQRESKKLHYRRNRAKYNESRRTTRKQHKENLDCLFRLIGDVKTSATQLRTELEGLSLRKAVMDELTSRGLSVPPSPSQFIFDGDDHANPHLDPSYQIFSRMAVYFLKPIKFAKRLPDRGHYKLLSRLMHPDKRNDNIDPIFMTYLNASWKNWEQTRNDQGERDLTAEYAANVRNALAHLPDEENISVWEAWLRATEPLVRIDPLLFDLLKSLPSGEEFLGKTRKRNEEGDSASA